MRWVWTLIVSDSSRKLAGHLPIKIPQEVDKLLLSPMLASLCVKVSTLKTNSDSLKESIPRVLWWILRNMKFLLMISLLQIIHIVLFPPHIPITVERVQLNLPKLSLRLFHQGVAGDKNQVDEKAKMQTTLRRALDRQNTSRSLKKCFPSKDLRWMYPFSLME